MRPRRSPLLLGEAIMGGLVAVAVLAPLLSPYGPQELAGDSLEAPSLHHLLGTNHIGQDIFSQVVWGTRASLSVALPAAALAITVGVLVGLAVGLLRGLPELVATRALDVVLAVPALPVIVLVIALLGPSRPTTVVVIGLVGWPAIARTVRAQTRTVRQRGFVSAARGFGGGRRYVLRRHVVPALVPVIVALFVQLAAVAVFFESGLAFLGQSDPTVVSWGQVLSQALGHQGLYNTARWVWWVVPPGLALTLAVVGLTLLGSSLEPRFNPRMTGGTS